MPLPRGGGGTPNVSRPRSPRRTGAPRAGATEAGTAEARAAAEGDQAAQGAPEARPAARGRAQDARDAGADSPPRTGPPERGTGAATGAVRDGTGRGTETPGIEFGPAGPGVPGGSDSGDYYLASVQRKIWMLWTQRSRPTYARPVTVSFTILANGSVEDVRVVESSGAALLDMAARGPSSAAPFDPLPKDYGTNRYTIQAIFRPTAQ